MHRLQVRGRMNIQIASTIRARLIGLLGKDEFDGALLLTPCNDVHTIGMHRAIDISFIARDGTILEAHRDVRPGRRLRNRNATAVLERFACSDPWLEPPDRLQVVPNEVLNQNNPVRLATRRHP